MSRLARLSIILSALAVASACTDRTPGPTALGITASRNGAPFSAGLASPAWQAMAFAQVPRPPALNALSAARAYALLGVAQYLGVQRADMAVGDGDNDGGRTQLEAERGAVAGASAVVLTYLFPGAAPAFGSDAFNAALTEVRNLSNARTPEQVRLAGAWAGNPGTITPPGIWLQVGTDDITARGLSEREATHLYALLSATMLDALIGCWDAKQTYWLIRPWQADVGVATLAAVGRPNHPSYPSGHSCLSASGAEVLSTFFPEDRDRLSAMVIEAGLSRMWAGIHYGFDISSGQELGRDVAHFAIAADASGNSLLTPR